MSLQADLRAVVARALSGLDMFSESDGKLSPTVSAGVVTPFSPQPSGDLMAGMRGMSGQATVVPRKTTLREGVFTGLTTLMNQAAPTQVTRHSSTGGAITPGAWVWFACWVQLCAHLYRAGSFMPSACGERIYAYCSLLSQLCCTAALIAAVSCVCPLALQLWSTRSRRWLVRQQLWRRRWPA